MKKIICVTPKISFTEYKNERIELEYNWINYLKKMNYQVMTLNETNISYFKKFRPSCIIISGHIRTNHDIFNKKIKLNVNSYHKYSFKILDKSFNEVFYHKDKSIELAISSKNKVMLSMFHPERPNKDQNKINKIIKLFLS